MGMFSAQTHGLKFTATSSISTSEMACQPPLHKRVIVDSRGVSSRQSSFLGGQFRRQLLLGYDNVLSEIRPYLAGTGGGVLELVQIDDYVIKVRLSGPAAGVMTVRVALTQKLREKIPAIAAVQLID
ncbi:hypothetical protein CRG98_024794 [Punica granatum]|uniref:NIF system FeS cluster assembly NifU C-terminal domain-containing protein n=1 Tax=Punica granatum TaxID=22663 RepID=A0A2I0JFV2_PUNGR|nr:hypothetical protein CRG98_024794 [Punica granatum]